MRRVFRAEKRLTHALYAFMCVYGHIMRENMRIYAKYIIKSLVKRLTHTRTHAIIKIYWTNEGIMAKLNDVAVLDIGSKKYP